MREVMREVTREAMREVMREVMRGHPVQVFLPCAAPSDQPSTLPGGEAVPDGDGPSYLVQE